MNRACVIYLIHDNPGTHGVHVAATSSELMRYAVRTSAGRAEYYQAGAIGLQPECIFHLALVEEYDGEKRLKYDNRLYDIIRTYETEDGGIELTAQRSESR